MRAKETIQAVRVKLIRQLKREKWTLEDIGKVFGITRERVRQLLK